MGLSKCVLGFLNVITTLVSALMIAVGIWLVTKQNNSDCIGFLKWVLIAVGGFILLISLLGLSGTCCRSKCLLSLYLILMFLLIIALFTFVVFVFIVTNGSGQDMNSMRENGVGYSEYKLEQYSSWLRKRLAKGSSWDKIKSCLQDSKVCNNNTNDYVKIVGFYRQDASSIQDGCCKPPYSCNYTYEASTNMWNMSTSNTSNMSTSSNVLMPLLNDNCSQWSNNNSRLCYECDSCRAGLLEYVRITWHKVSIACVVVLVILLVIYSLGCCVFIEIRHKSHYKS